MDYMDNDCSSRKFYTPCLNAEDCSLRLIATAALGGRATGDVAVTGDAAGHQGTQGEG